MGDNRVATCRPRPARAGVFLQEQNFRAGPEAFAVRLESPELGPWGTLCKTALTMNPQGFGSFFKKNPSLSWCDFRLGGLSQPPLPSGRSGGQHWCGSRWVAEPLSQVLRGLHAAPTSAGRREGAGPRGRLLSSRGGPRPGEGDTGAIPLVQQWTMATPVNTLCSFPFNLQAQSAWRVYPHRGSCPTARSHRPLSACVCLWSCSKVRRYGTWQGPGAEMP